MRASIFEVAIVAEGMVGGGKHTRHVGQLPGVAQAIIQELHYSFENVFPLTVTTPSAQEVLPIPPEDIDVIKQLMCNEDLAIPYCLLQFGWLTPQQLGLPNRESLFG